VPSPAGRQAKSSIVLVGGIAISEDFPAVVASVNVPGRADLAIVRSGLGLE
jgi:hypothetical protein